MIASCRNEQCSLQTPCRGGGSGETKSKSKVERSTRNNHSTDRTNSSPPSRIHQGNSKKRDVENEDKRGSKEKTESTILLTRTIKENGKKHRIKIVIKLRLMPKNTKPPIEQKLINYREVIVKEIKKKSKLLNKNIIKNIRKKLLNTKEYIMKLIRIEESGEGKRYYHKHREEEGYRGLRNLYNITKEQYDEMFMKQNGCCAICGIHHTLLTKKLYVDHNHDTGELRGLLCNKCNLGLGIFGDDVSLLQKATDYLNKFVSEKEINFPKSTP